MALIALLVVGCDILELEDLESISISPLTQSVEKGATTQFTATGSFADGTTSDITDNVTWESSNTDVATIANYGNEGLATGVATGQATISASYRQINSSSNAALTVLNNTATIVNITNKFNRTIVYEIWKGEGLTYEKSQVVGYGEKVYPTGSSPRSILDNATDSASISKDEAFSSLLVVVGVPFEGINYYLTDKSFTSLGASLDMYVCENGNLSTTSCP